MRRFVSSLLVIFLLPVAHADDMGVSCPKSPAEVSELSKSLEGLIATIQNSAQCAPIKVEIEDINKKLASSDIGSLLRGATQNIQNVSPMNGTGGARQSVGIKQALYELTSEQFEKLKGDTIGIIEKVFKVVSLAGKGSDCGIDVKKMVLVQMADIVANITKLSSTFVGPYGVPLQVGGDMISAILLAMGKNWSTMAFNMDVKDDREFFTKNLCAYSEFYRKVETLLDNQESKVMISDVLLQAEGLVEQIKIICMQKLGAEKCAELQRLGINKAASRKSDSYKKDFDDFKNECGPNLGVKLVQEWYNNLVVIDDMKTQLKNEKVESLGPDFVELMQEKNRIDDLYYQRWSPRYLQWLSSTAATNSALYVLEVMRPYVYRAGAACKAETSFVGIPDVVKCISEKAKSKSLSGEEKAILQKVRILSQMTDVYDHYCDFFEDVSVKTGSLKDQCDFDRRMNVLRDTTARSRAMVNEKLKPIPIGQEVDPAQSEQQNSVPSGAAATFPLQKSGMPFAVNFQKPVVTLSRGLENQNTWRAQLSTDVQKKIDEIRKEQK